MELAHLSPTLQTMIQYSYPGIFVVSLLANMIVPVPEEITLLGIGYIIGTGLISFWITLPIVVGGLFLSDTALFYLARRGNRFIKAVYERIFSNRLTDDAAFMRAHIGKVIFVSRFLVQLRFLGPFLAGQAHISYKRFAAYDLFALTVYVSIFLFIGNVFRNKFELIMNGFGQVRSIILVGVVLYIGYIIVKSYMQFSFLDLFTKIIKKTARYDK